MSKDRHPKAQDQKVSLPQGSAPTAVGSGQPAYQHHPGGRGWAGGRLTCCTPSVWPEVPSPSAVCLLWPGEHWLHSFSNGKRWEASAARLLRVIFVYSGFGSSVASRFCGQEAARTLAASACELVPSSSSEESPPPAFAWGAAVSFWGKEATVNS